MVEGEAQEDSPGHVYYLLHFLNKLFQGCPAFLSDKVQRNEELAYAII